MMKQSPFLTSTLKLYNHHKERNFQYNILHEHTPLNEGKYFNKQLITATSLIHKSIQQSSRLSHYSESYQDILILNPLQDKKQIQCRLMRKQYQISPFISQRLSSGLNNYQKKVQNQGDRQFKTKYNPFQQKYLLSSKNQQLHNYAYYSSSRYNHIASNQNPVKKRSLQTKQYIQENRHQFDDKTSSKKSSEKVQSFNKKQQPEKIKSFCEKPSFSAKQQSEIKQQFGKKPSYITKQQLEVKKKLQKRPYESSPPKELPKYEQKTYSKPIIQQYIQVNYADFVQSDVDEKHFQSFGKENHQQDYDFNKYERDTFMPNPRTDSQSIIDGLTKMIVKQKQTFGIIPSLKNPFLQSPVIKSAFYQSDDDRQSGQFIMPIHSDKILKKAKQIQFRSKISNKPNVYNLPNSLYLKGKSYQRIYTI